MDARSIVSREEAWGSIDAPAAATIPERSAHPTAIPSRDVAAMAPSSIDGSSGGRTISIASLLEMMLSSVDAPAKRKGRQNPEPRLNERSSEAELSAHAAHPSTLAIAWGRRGSGTSLAKADSAIQPAARI
eukprot:scaffold113130_cov31-Tisochrysis_lutea.AAC.6